VQRYLPENPLRRHISSEAGRHQEGRGLEKTIQPHQAPLSGSPAKRISEKSIVSLLFTFMYFRSTTRRRFLLQFDPIVINGGADEIF